MKKKYLLITFLFFYMKIDAQWNLVWADEFTNTTINTANWVFETGGGGWGNSELENYTNRPANAIISNGNLLIIAKKESYGGSNYTSARMKTQGLQSWTYGKVEARIKIPLGKGVWPAFWMLGNSIYQAQVGWPKCGEIDIMEHVNNNPKINGTMHWDNNGHAQYGGDVDYSPTTAYHVYSVEWDTSAIKWFLDGTKYWEANIANNINSTDEFHSPFFILLNLAIGGTWPGNPDATTTFPDTMFVDYVRVYKQIATSIKENSDLNTLFESYPNPFNGTTTIHYSISKDAAIELNVIDFIGNKVAVIERGNKLKGDYSAKWNAQNMAVGMYLLQLKVNDQVLTKKIIITK